MIVLIPPKHLSQRALWWLKHSTLIMPESYPKEYKVGVPACLVHAAEAMLKENIKRSTADNLIACLARVGDEWKTEGLGTTAHDNWSCAVADVRAMYLTVAINEGLPPGVEPRTIPAITAKAKQSGGFQWQQRDITMPTCSTCKVLLEQAMETLTDKTGKYPMCVQNGILSDWQELKAKVNVVPQGLLTAKQLASVK